MQNDVIVESPLDNLIATTEETIGRIMKSNDKYRADAIALYMFYNYTGHWQAKGSKSTATRYNPQANNNYAMKCLGWGETRFRGAKKLLESLGLIEIKQKSDGKGTSTYVNVRFIPSEEKSRGVVSRGAGIQGAGYRGQIQVTSKEIQDTSSKYIYGQESEEPTELFSEFWKAYPKKVAKTTAEKAFKKQKIDRAKLDEILSFIEKAKKTESWTKQKGQFIPHPSTFLNGKRWEDDLASYGQAKPNTILTSPQGKYDNLTKTTV